MCIYIFKTDAAFLLMYNQKCTVMGIIERYITSNDDFIGIFVLWDKYDTEWHTLLLKSLNSYVNIIQIIIV